MNLILLFDQDFPSGAGGRIARLQGRRLQHVIEIHQAALGDQLVVGVAGDRVGRGRVIHLDDSRLDLEVTLEVEPPAKLNLMLVLALPRPPVLKRVVAAATAMGVDRIVLLHARRVEKTYWNARASQPEALRQAITLGLEQARDTVLPSLELRPRFLPFVQDELPALASGRIALVAHPEADCACPARVDAPALLAVGPEGGWLDYEIEKLEASGLLAVHLGPRALRVETAIPVLLSRAMTGAGQACSASRTSRS